MLRPLQVIGLGNDDPSIDDEDVAGVQIAVDPEGVDRLEGAGDLSEDVQHLPPTKRVPLRAEGL